MKKLIAVDRAWIAVLAIAGALIDPGAVARAQSTADAMERCHSYTGPESSNPDRAIAGCTAVIESDRFTINERLDALAARGVLFRKTGQFDLAVVDLTEVLRVKVAADDVYVERGMALVATQQPALAMKDFDESLRLNPSNTNALSQRAVAYRQQGRYDDAIRDLDRAVTLKPQDPWAVSERGLDHLSKADYDLAIRDFDRSLQLTPMSAWVIAERGSAYRMKGQYARAIVDLTNAIALDEDGWSFDQRGAAYLQLGQYDKAIADFSRGFELDEGDAWALYARGIAKQKRGDVEGADADMRAARALRTDVAAQVGRDGLLGVTPR